MNCLLGIVLARVRIAEIDQVAVAEMSRDEFTKRLDRLDDTRVIGAYEFIEVFRIKTRAQCGRTDQIAETR